MKSYKIQRLHSLKPANKLRRDCNKFNEKFDDDDTLKNDFFFQMKQGLVFFTKVINKTEGD